jgi:two-component system sensor histidine kinase/response regulator
MLNESPLAQIEPVQASATPVAVVNPQMLAQIVGRDPAVIVKFLRLFLANVDKGAAEIRAAFGKRSAEDIVTQAHKLKSAARAVGANPLAQLCERLEQAGKDADWAALDTASLRLEPEFAAVERFIRAHTTPPT